MIRNGDSSHTITEWAVREAAGHRYTFGTLRLRAGWQARMMSAKIACHEPDPNVTTQSPVVWRSQERDTRRKSAQPPVGHIDKVGMREQRQNSLWRVRNPGT